MFLSREPNSILCDWKEKKKKNEKNEELRGILLPLEQESITYWGWWFLALVVSHFSAGAELWLYKPVWTISVLRLFFSRGASSSRGAVLSGAIPPACGLVVVGWVVGDLEPFLGISGWRSSCELALRFFNCSFCLMKCLCHPRTPGFPCAIISAASSSVLNRIILPPAGSS